jgi:hypothetical protein
LRSALVGALVGCLLGCPHVGYAQQSVAYGSVSGRVVDPSGAAVAGAQVAARHTDTNLVSETITDVGGRFRFPYLRVGPYEIVIHQQGFADATRRLTVSAGAAFELPAALAIRGLDASVTVSGDATVLEAARSQIAGTVLGAEVANLPLNGRNFLDVALLVPGVSITNVNSSQLFPETSAVPGVSLSVNSQRNVSNNFIIDGLSGNDDAAALSGITYGVDAIEQVQVVTSGGQAELGRALGGYVNVVTKSGTNVVRGTVYDFMRDDRLNAENPIARMKLPMEQWQYGGSLGGPLVRDRAFYFANAEQRRLDQTGLVRILSDNAAAVNARLAAVGYQGSLVETGIYPNPVDSSNVLARIDHQAGQRDRVSVRYSLYDISSTNARGAGALNAPSASSSLDNIDHAVAVGNTLTLSPRTVLETRAQFAFGDLNAPPTDPIGPAVSIAGVGSFGTSSGSPTRRINRLYQLVNNISHHAGAHALRAGADVLYNDDDITYPRAIRGSYAFSSLANFVNGVYNNAGFSQTFGATDVAQGNANVGIYAQDEWKLTSSITANIGVRYDLQFLETLDTDADNVSPRVGIAWSPSSARHTVVRGSAGIFYDRVPLRAVANALLSAGNTTDLANLRQIVVTLSPTQAGAPQFPGILTGVTTSVTLPQLTTMDRHLQNASSRQASVEVERQLDDRTTVTIGYQYVQGRNLLMSINQNVPSCPPAGTNNGCRPNPSYGNNNQYSSAGASNYHGLHLSAVRRPTKWGAYRVSYTLSKSMNDLGEFFFSSPIDPFDLSKDWGRSDDDQRHRLVVSGSIQTPAEAPSTLLERITHGVEASAMLQAYSAPPFNITSGVTTLQGTAGRPIVNGAFIERNAGVGTPFVSLNARVRRTFRASRRLAVDAIAEVFNLTNHRNVLTRNTNFGAGAYPVNPAADFGQVTAVSEPRAVQFGIRAKF